MAEKVFHPTMEGSTVKELDHEMLGMCALFLHDLGWPTQQGMFDVSVERLRWWVENAPDVFFTACANGLTLILDALPDNVPAPLSCKPHILHSHEEIHSR